MGREQRQTSNRPTEDVEQLLRSRVAETVLSRWSERVPWASGLRYARAAQEASGLGDELCAADYAQYIQDTAASVGSRFEAAIIAELYSINIVCLAAETGEELYICSPESYAAGQSTGSARQNASPTLALLYTRGVTGNVHRDLFFT